LLVISVAYENNKTLVSYKPENDNNFILVFVTFVTDGKINKGENKPELVFYSYIITRL